MLLPILGNHFVEPKIILRIALCTRIKFLYRYA